MVFEVLGPKIGYHFCLISAMCSWISDCSQLSLNVHLYKTDTSLDGQLVLVPAVFRSFIVTKLPIRWTPLSFLRRAKGTLKPSTDTCEVVF